LISRKLKLLLIAGAVVALIGTLAGAIYTRADLSNEAASEIAKSDAGQILPSYRRGIFTCSLPISECEKIMSVLPMSMKISPSEIGGAFARSIERSL
jgi:uncharacterized membrane protein